jgi:hypothetical protein
MMRSEPSDQPQIVVPQFCRFHQHELIVRELRIPESGPWMSSTVIAQILMFQAAAASERVAKRTENDANALSLVLNELGCLACAFPRAWRRAIRVMLKGFHHAAQVSKREVQDPDWQDGSDA